MSATVGDLVRHLKEFAPLHSAASWDNVGLLLGDPAAVVTKAMTCLTVTPTVSVEAVAAGANLIVTHHPILFRGVKSLTMLTPEGATLLPLLRAGIAVYSPHTAFDNCPGGINDDLAVRAGLTAVRPLRLRRGAASDQVKLAVFTPENALDMISAALFEAGCGRIGAYTECSFRAPGVGTFFGSESTQPAVGERGRCEQVEEVRLEVVVPNGLVREAIRAVRAAHPYEEPAFDLYPLQSPMSDEGEGRIGELASSEPLGQFARRMQQALSANRVQIVGDSERLVRRVAVACGAAGDYLPDAVAAQADLFLTGEMRFHDLLAAEAAGIALLLPGHYATERPAVERLAERLAAAFPDIEVFASRVERDPLVSVNPA